MRPFHTIAVPHRDILEGRLTMDVFAADLWETYNKRAPSEYRDSELFFNKTYLTNGLKSLLDAVERRLRGKGGDPVIQIQTPFGGGKTHALIALYHRAIQWKVKPVVVVGTALNPIEDTLWGLLEKQLTGGVRDFAQNISPGRDALRALLSKHEPVLILMDEVLEYITKAGGVPVGETSLAAQTMAFMQELTEAVATLESVSIVMTLPSSLLEHYDDRSEKLFGQLQKIAGRVERIYTPVQENEITKVVRSRLFSSIDEKGAKSVITHFISYAEREGILPKEVDASDYRNSFVESYPFIPEVIDTLYHRWGSFPTFQRTRGVLRLLSLVIYSMKESGRPYITLSDFDLAEQDVRRELIKHIGPEFDSVIASDITNRDAGSRKVDSAIGKSYRGLRIGTRGATCIFLYSFSGGQEKGAHIGDIKMSATTTDNPSSIVGEAVEQLKNKLFYLQSQNDKYFFLNQPNMNRILLTKMENVNDGEVLEFEKELLGSQLSGAHLKVFLWPNSAKDIPDTPDLKLIIVPQDNKRLMSETLESKGGSPRVYRNTLIFLYPSEAERITLRNSIKRLISYKQIQGDKTLSLSDEQRREVSGKVQMEERDLPDVVKKCYRLVRLPGKDALKENDLGVPTYGEKKKLDDLIYEQLRLESEILEKISSIIIKEKYLRERDFAKIRLIYDSMLKTPGESRIVSQQAFEMSIAQGVKQGAFGIGELTGDNAPVCNFFKEEVKAPFGEDELIIRDSICSTQKGSDKNVAVSPILPAGIEGMGNVSAKAGNITDTVTTEKKVVRLDFHIPRGKISQIMGMMNLLQTRFDDLRISIAATNGSISQEDYENKIRETLRQLGIEIIEE